MITKPTKRRGRPRGARNKATPEQLRWFSPEQAAMLIDSESGPSGGARPELTMLDVLNRFTIWRQLGFGHREAVRLAGAAPHMLAYYKGSEQDATKWAREWLKYDEHDENVLPGHSFPRDLPAALRPLRLSQSAVDEVVTRHRRDKLHDFRRLVRQNLPIEAALRAFCYEGAFGFAANQAQALDDARNYLIQNGVTDIEIPRIIPHE